MSDNKEKTPERIRIENLSLSLGGRQILKDFCAVFTDGINAVCGPNGSGKTSLLRVIKGLVKPSSGSIVIDGEDLSRSTSARLSRVGLVFQDADVQTVGETVEKDIEFGPANLGWDRGKIQRVTDGVIELLGMEDYRKKRPLVLSGGEKRCLAIAGVLAMESRIILMDEPFANLDLDSVQKVLCAVMRLKEQGICVVIVSHETDKFLALADNVAVMDKGQCVYCGPAADSLDALRTHGVHVAALPLEKMSWLPETTGRTCTEGEPLS